LPRIDYYFGSIYEEKDDLFTGKIVKHIGVEGKLDYLIEFCNIYGYESSECIAVGDGDTDIPIFNFCGNSIGINCSDVMVGKAKHHVVTDDLLSILKYII
jgi:phosphoserine phosphatase